MAFIELNQNDTTSEIAKKCNRNFRQLDDYSSRSTRLIGQRIEDLSYNGLQDKPSIESVELVGNKTFPDLGIFKTDDQGYDVPDDYTLTSSDINSLWANAVPIALGA